MLFVRRSSPSITSRNSNSRRTTTSSGTSLKKQTFSCKESLIHGKSRSTTKWWNGDGGQFTGISDNLMKYGIVPSDVMVETYSSDNTSRMSNLIGLKLKEYGLELRDAKGSKLEALAKRKTEMLGEIYRMLVLNLRNSPGHAKTQAANRSRQKNTPRNHSIRNSWAKI